MSFFVPSVHVGRSRHADPDDPFSGRLPFGARRRPKRKKDPIPWSCDIPYMCQILLVFLSGFVVLLSGVSLSVLGYYPGHFANKNSYNGTDANVVQNKLVYYHVRNMAFIGPVLMGVGCFAMITAGVIYMEFRDKYFRDLPQDEIKTMSKQDVRTLLVDQCRHNYFRGIPIPLTMPKTDVDPKTNEQPSPVLPPDDLVTKLNVRKGSSASVGNSLAPMVSHGFSELQRAHSTSTLPSMRPTLILAPANLHVEKTFKTSPSVYCGKHPGMDQGSLVAAVSLAPSSLSGRSSATGVENPAYLSDDSSDTQNHPSDPVVVRVDSTLRKNLSESVSPLDPHFTSVVVHAASIHFPTDATGMAETPLPKCKSLVCNAASNDNETFTPVVPNSAHSSCPVLEETVLPGQVNDQASADRKQWERMRSLKNKKRPFRKKRPKSIKRTPLVQEKQYKTQESNAAKGRKQRSSSVSDRTTSKDRENNFYARVERTSGQRRESNLSL